MRVRQSALLMALIGLLGCTPAVQSTHSGVRPAASPLGAPKTLTVGVLAGTPTFAPWDSTNPSTGGPALTELHVNALVTNDLAGGVEPRLASALPSAEHSTIQFLPDGRMRTVWPLRSNIKWHDGAPFTADDFVFTWEVLTASETPSTSNSKWVQLIDGISAEDPLTVVITWKAAYYAATDMNQRVLWPLPRHRLGDALRRDVEVFRNSPFWTTEYVHLGPFRLQQFGIDNMVFHRFDDYFLGAPKLDRIIVKVIGDANAMVAHMSAAAIDMAAESTLPPDVGVRLQEEWQRTGAATVLFRPQSWHYLHFQLEPRFAQPVELASDARVRRALFQSVDRRAMRAFLFPGLPEVSPDSFLLPKDPRRAIAGEPFARYPYDPTAAVRLLEDVGWLRGSDGRMLDRLGQPVDVEIQAEERDARERAIMVDSFRTIGIQAREFTNSRNQADEARAMFPGLASTGRTVGPGVLVYFHSRQNATAQNRWLGQNKNHYANPILDDLIDRLYETVDERDQGLLMKTIGDVLVEDMPVIPVYFRTISAAIARGVHALDDFAGSDSGTMSRNAHLWDRE